MSPQLELAPRPQVTPPARWQFPAPQRHLLDNGITVYLHHMPGQHVATVLCRLAIPLDAEPDGCDGIAAVMAAAALSAGTRGSTARRFEQQAAAAAITWTAAAFYPGPVITLELPATQLAPALILLRLALAEPAFEPAETAGQIQRAAASLAYAAANPETRLGRELPAAIYGDACRAGRPADGTLAAITQLPPEAIAGFYDAQVRPAGITIVIAGDLTGIDAAGLANDAFATWRDSRPSGTSTPGPAPQPRQAGAAVLVNQPGAAQTHLLLAVPVPGRGEPGWNELRVAAHTLGAPITGRLDTELRERSGDSYGIRAALTELVPGTGLLTVAGAVGSPATRDALASIAEILTAPLHDGFSPAEHAAATEAITRVLPLAYETPATLAASTADLAACGLPAGYPGLLLDEIGLLTSEHVNSAYQRYFSLDRLTLIAAGDAAHLAGPLQQLAGPTPLQVINA